MRSNGNSHSQTEYYDVFLNFRSPDTRDDVISVLREDLKTAPGNLAYFYDDESMRCSEGIKRKIEQGIRNSQIYICVFSESYASSKWCLIELAMMNDERKSHGKHILPIFYRVKVDDVKLKTESYQVALQGHAAERPETVERWRKALVEVAGIKGLEMCNIRDLTKLSKRVVDDVNRLLITTRPPLSYFLVGIEEKVAAVVGKLDIDSSDVQLLIIHGESGIGKTTLAREVFNRLCSRFEGCSFIHDIDGSQLHRPQYSSYTYLMKQVLVDIPHDGKEGTCPIVKEELKRAFSERFRNKKVLIVLDNVACEKDIKRLRHVWFGPGSRIIVTTKASRLVALAQDSPIIPEAEHFRRHGYKMERLSEDNQGLELFCRHAFRKAAPPEEFRQQSFRVVSYIGGLPLTLEILGAFLHRGDEKKWEDTEEELSRINDKVDKVRKMLKISFDALTPEGQSIFLDIACFFVNQDITKPMQMWQNKNGDNSGFECLSRVALVKIVNNDKLWMHDQLRDLGRDLVQKDELHCRRYWKHNEAFEVLQENEENDTIQAIRLCNDEKLHMCKFEPQNFQMKNMRFLKLYSGSVTGNLRPLKKLRWLSWRCCPSDQTAISLCCASLVILDLSLSSITDEWVGWKQLKWQSLLRVLDLRGCTKLRRMPSLSVYCDLETLILEGCNELAEIDSSIGELKKLKCLNIKGCDSLEKLPEEIGKLKGLTELMITKQKRDPLALPESIRKLKSLETLNINNVEFSHPQSPIPINGLEKLKCLSLFKCAGTKNLLNSLADLPSLVELDISKTQMEELPDSLRSLKELRVIKMECSMIKRLPGSIVELKNLEELHAKYSKLEGDLPDRFEELTKLRILDLWHTRVRKVSNLPQKLEFLRLNFWPLRAPNLSELTSLVDLAISSAKQRRNLPPKVRLGTSVLQWIQELTKLEKLELVIPSSTKEFSFPDQLKSLILSCKDLAWCPRLPPNLSSLFLAHLELEVGTKLQHLDDLKKLSSLQLYKCNISGILEVGDVTSLLHLSGSRCFFGMKQELLHLPALLQVLSLKDCEFQMDSLLNLTLLKCLKQLELVGCDGVVAVKGIGQLHQLQELEISECDSLKWFEDWDFLEKIKRDRRSRCTFSCHVNLPNIGLFLNQLG